MKSTIKTALMAVAMQTILNGCVTTSDIGRQFAVKDYSGALHNSQDILETEPHNFNAMLYQGWSEFALGRYSHALATFKRLREIRPVNYDGYLGRAWISIVRGDYKAATVQLNKAESWCGYHRRSSLYAARGWLAFYQGDTDSAERWFHKSEEYLSFPNKTMYSIDRLILQAWSSGPQVGLGWVALARGDLETAGKKFQKGLDREPTCHHCYDGLVQIALQQGNRAKAHELAIKGLSQAGYDRSLVDTLNRLLRDSRDPKLSVETYSRIVDAMPDVPSFNAQLGYALYYAGRLPSAWRKFVQVRTKLPDDELAMQGEQMVLKVWNSGLQQGWKQYEAGVFDTALHHFEAKLRKAGEMGNPQAEYGRGMTLLALGQYQEARTAFRNSLKIVPGYPAAYNGLMMADMQMTPGYLEAMSNLVTGETEAAERTIQQMEGKGWAQDSARGWLAYHEGNYAEAERIFEDVVATHPHAYPAQRGLGVSLQKQRKWADASGPIIRSLLQNPWQGITAIKLPAQRLLDANRAGEAMMLLRMGVHAYPESVELMRLLSRAYRNGDDEYTAKQWANRAQKNRSKWKRIAANSLLELTVTTALEKAGELYLTGP